MANLLRKFGNLLSYHFNDAPARFTRAAAHNDFEKVDSLLEQYGPELVNKVGITRSSALMNAAMNGHEKMVDHLLARGAKANYSDHTGKTALMDAAYSQQDSIYQKLVSHGANENAVDKYGHTVKWYAETGKARMNSARTSTSSDENVMTSPAHIAHPLNIYNPWR